ncbi:Ephrin-B2a [Desmophyllum pertusum]|uniref:Ephrin-B2a n=1 Tax=Desmophyllum pertusum TaxID=174260 RepID=A0A9X0A944_9CNID|nr:Ephrin-B2a [Desmophyllum pertusum]
MHHERYSVLFLAQIVLFFQVLEGAVYPSIHWSPQNPLFDSSDNILYVLPMSKLHIVCPNPTTVMKKVQDNTSKDKLYQNFWIVSRESYERCNTDYTQGSRLLLRCITP